MSEQEGPAPAPHREAPKPAVVQAARAIRGAAEAGKMTRADYVELATAVRDAGRAFTRPDRRPAKGWIEARSKKCGRAACACATDPARAHGPYLYLAWREGKRKRSKYLGYWERAELPPDAIAPLREELERHREAARRAVLGALHDD